VETSLFMNGLLLFDRAHGRSARRDAVDAPKGQMLFPKRRQPADWQHSETAF
jgi:hypothetical protein